MEDWISVAKSDEFAPGDRRVVETQGGTRIVVFNFDGEYYAIEDMCTHDYAPLDGGVIEGGAIICPRHGARFCIKTGEALSPPAYEAITTFPVRVGNGVIFVRDNRFD
ncbi:MAG: non-heme iron oxygenase ferredoxin subunit [Gammaproteobacteria bacterium]